MLPRRSPIAAAVVALLAVTAVGASVAAIVHGGDGRRSNSRAASLPAQTHPVITAAVSSPGPRVSVRKIQFVFSTADGRMFGVGTAHQKKCLVFSAGPAQCADPEEIRRGHVFAVQNDCARMGTHAMTIVGLVPAGVRVVRLLYSNSTAASSHVIRGAFKFDLRTPQEHQPYPVAIVWLGRRSQQIRNENFPIGPIGFCHPGGFG